MGGKGGDCHRRGRPTVPTDRRSRAAPTDRADRGAEPSRPTAEADRRPSRPRRHSRLVNKMPERLWLAQMRALWFVLKRDFKNAFSPCGISKHPVLNIYYYLISGWDSDPVPDLRWTPLGFYGGQGGRLTTCDMLNTHVIRMLNCIMNFCNGEAAFLGYTHNRVM